MAKDLYIPVTLRGNRIEAKATLGQTVIVTEGPDTYTGPVTVTPTETEQTLLTKDKLVTDNVTVNPIPSEYTDAKVDYDNALTAFGVESDLADGINALTTYSNSVTGEADETLSDAVRSLADGYNPNGVSLNDWATGASPTGDVVITAERITRNNTFSALPMTTVSLPNLTTVSGSNSFQNCPNLTHIDAPNLDSITANGFVADCINLESVNFPNLREITGAAIFQGTTKLKEIVLPNVTKITTYIANGRHLRLDGAVIKLGKKAELGTMVFNGCMKTGDIYLPWSEGEVSGAPWQAPTGATIHYDTVYDSDWNVVSST